jgi:hypothetical protein
MFLGPLDPDPDLLARGMVSDPSRREETQVSPQRNPREQEAQYVRDQEEGQRRSS